MKKRQEEMHRRNKLLNNTRSFKYGVDHASLDQQLMEKRAKLDGDWEEDEYYGKTVVLQEQVAQACEEIKAAAARERKKETVAYSLANLRKEQRREYHLSDPNELKKERILTEEEIRSFGPSSMMMGERVEDALAKKKDKQMQTRAWLQEQMREKAERQVAARELDLRYDQEMLLANEVRGLCEQAAQVERREEKCAEAADNKEIAEQHRQRRQMKLNKNIMMNDSHVNFIMNNNRMQEKYDYSTGLNYRKSTEYRPFSQAERQDIHNCNATQILNKRVQKRAEQLQEGEQAALNMTVDELLGAVEAEKKRMVLERRLKAEEENRILAANKAHKDIVERRKYLSFDQRD